MKTVSYVISITLFSALMISPIGERKYPTAKVSEQRIEISLKEKELNRVISLIEHNLEVERFGVKD
jgi:hypothetical protein